MKFIRMDEIKRLFGLLGRWTKSYFAGLIGCSITGALTNIFLAYVLKNLIDAAGQKRMDLFINAIVLTVIVCLILGLARPIFEYIFSAGVKHCMADTRRKIFKHVARLKMKYFDDIHSADIISRINNDVQVMEDCYSQDLKNVVSCVVYGIGSAISMLLTDLWFSMALLILGVLTILVNIAFAKPIRKMSDEIQVKTALVTERFSDILAGFQIIKIFGIGEIMNRKFAAENRELAEANVKRTKINSWLDLVNFLLSWFNFGGVMTIGAFMVISGSISFGKLMAIVQLLNGVVYMFQNIGSFITRLQTSLAGANRVFEILDEEVEPDSIGMVSSDYSDMVNSGVELENVTFSYIANEKTLDGFSFTVKKGEVAALVGASGGGKSTVFKLLLGFYPPDSGNVLIEGRPVGRYSLEELRNLTAYVSQDSFLFNVSIKENIRYGRPDASDEEIENAAKLAYAHEFILEQPLGYSTVVGENGSGLSGGQKQRISIARAFLKNAPILLLDEATSSLDSKSEELVQAALAELMKNRTAIIIAHRLSTIEKADMIYVVEDGKVVEKGKHSFLCSLDGIYTKLYRMQFAN